MATTKKNSAYRHAYTDEPTQLAQKYADLPKPNESNASKVLAASSRWLAMAKYGAGGPINVRAMDHLGREGNSLINTHKGKVTDMAFSPFNHSLLISGAEDTNINAVQIQADEAGNAKAMSPGDELFSLQGHEKKVSFIAPNPTSDNILASSSWDKTVRIWDMNTQAEVFSNGSHPHTTFCLEWNRNGSLLATTCKDHQLRVFDPRCPEDEVRTVEAFQSSKCSKAFWIPKHNWLGVFGFTKQSKRQCKIYDMANFETPIYKYDLDKSSSTMFPTWDDETNLVWLWSKGDGSMTFFELGDQGGAYMKPLGVQRSATPTKGGCFIPKTALATDRCEVARFMKLTNNPCEIVPLSFVVPRKTTGFSQDLFPDCPGTEPAQTAEQWKSGADADPIMTSMDPNTLAAASGKEVKVKLTYAQLTEENAQLKARVAELEAQVEVVAEVALN